MKKRHLATILLASAAMGLTACSGGGGSGSGGGGGGDSSSGPTTDPATSQFTQHATWTFDLPAKGDALCYDFDTQQEVTGCSGDTWDLKILGDGSSATLWTNSGVSGPGAGGAFGGPFDHTWTELQTWNDARVDPVNGALPDAVYFADQSSGVFTGTNDIESAAFEYDLEGTHLLYPTYRVFLITTDSGSASAASTPVAPVYALQVIGYYGGSGGTTSGYPTIRWIDRGAPDDVRTQQIDASSGWVYFNLASGTEVGADGDWQIAFDRYNVRLNGGDSGSGKVAGFVGRTPDGLYDADGKPDKAAFLAATPASTAQYLTATDMATPATAQDWITDSHHSVLDPPYQGSYPDPLEFGWYDYYPTAESAAAAGLPAAHMLAATPEGASLLRSGEGDSYARFHLTGITYDPPTGNQPPYATQQHWTIEFDVEPASAP